MAQLLQRFERKHMVWLVNALVFLFFVTVLTFKKGYSYAPMTLAGVSIIYLFVHIFKFKKPLNFTKEDKWLIFAFLFYFGTFAFSAVYHGDGWREIDNPSRVLLFLPLLLLFREFPINIKVILHGIPIGAGLAGILACYQKFYLNLPKPFPYLMHIQAGDIAISLAMMSLAISIYWGIKKDYKLMIFCLICSGFGVIASALTGARGGWIAIPIIIPLIMCLYRKRLNKKIVLFTSLSMVCFTAFISINPKVGIYERYQVAKSDITRYIEKGHKSTSLGARLDMWENAVRGVLEKPFLGWGSYGYKELKEYQVKHGTMAESTLHFNDAHNQYIDHLVKRGILGFLGLGMIIIYPMLYFFLETRRADVSVGLRNIHILGLCHIFLIVIYSLSQTFFAHNSGFQFYIFILFLLYSLFQDRVKNR